MRSSKNSFALWNKKNLSWVMNPPKKLKKKMVFQCPHCDRIFPEIGLHTIKDLKFKVSFDLDSREFNLSDWICTKCASEINFETLSQELKNFINNLFIKNIQMKYLQPVLMIVKIKGGKEISGKALETGATYKSNQSAINYICGSCKNKNQFLTIRPNTKKIYQCRKCGFLNIVQTEFNTMGNLKNI
ncbi:hypothetical protein LCGC14_0496960 [marine sediment metagenome]|uniref:Uncharacterized protein n=1 Tax=marine sediment metagenome TaxID=412755 RepID=A0A0F9VDQ3_9ZZZZ